MHLSGRVTQEEEQAIGNYCSFQGVSEARWARYGAWDMARLRAGPYWREKHCSGVTRERQRFHQITLLTWSENIPCDVTHAPANLRACRRNFDFNGREIWRNWRGWQQLLPFVQPQLHTDCVPHAQPARYDREPLLYGQASHKWPLRDYSRSS